MFGKVSFRFALHGFFFMVALAAYLVVGFVYGAWHPGWVMLLAAVFFSVVAEMCLKYSDENNANCA